MYRIAVLEHLEAQQEQHTKAAAKADKELSDMHNQLRKVGHACSATKHACIPWKAMLVEA